MKVGFVIDYPVFVLHRHLGDLIDREVTGQQTGVTVKNILDHLGKKQTKLSFQYNQDCICMFLYMFMVHVTQLLARIVFFYSL